MKVAGRVLLIGLLASPALAGIVVSFNPPSQTVLLSAGSTTVDIVADIGDPLIGWGLDLTLTGTSVSQSGPPVIGPLFNPAYAPDGDGLAGLVPPPGTVSGPGVVLATILLSLDSLGTTYLDASITPGDLTEGFMCCDDLGNCYFADVEFVQGSVTVTPEPASLLLLALLGLLRRR